MSVFTTQIRFICESLGGNISQPYSGINQLIRKVRNQIFNFDYPIFDENYRPLLEVKILKHYYTREIGEESYGLWQLRLDTKMNEIMPYYNQLYESELIKFNPMYDTDLTTHSNRKEDNIRNDTTNFDGTQKEDSTQDITGQTKDVTDSDSTGTRDRTETDTFNGTKWDKFWDTPQNGLQPITDSQYLTNARVYDDDNTRSISEHEAIENTTDTTVDGTYSSNQTVDSTITTNNDTTFQSKINNIDDYWNTVIGKSGGKSYSQMLQEFRETFLNIDMMVIKELGCLFLNLWEGVE